MLVYNAGPLFSEAEATQRRYEGKLLNETLNKSNVEGVVINPIDLTPDPNKLYTSIEIYNNDYHYIKDCDAIFYDLSNEDAGSLVCLGMVIQMYISGQNKKIYPIFSDSRITRNGLSGLESSKGYNSFVIGAIKANNIKTYSSFKEAYLDFIKDFDLTSCI